MLGIASDASHAEVKRAYTAKALRVHPDRQGDATAAARDRAEWRMKELNAAWAVLRDPLRRRAYDEELRRALRREPERVAPREDLVEPEPLLADEEVVLAGSHPVLRYAPLLVVLTVLVVILIASAYAVSPGDDPDVVTTEPAPVGSCVRVVQAPADQQPTTPEVVEVDCAMGDARVVVDKIPFPRPCPPGTTAVPVPSEDLSVCLR